MTDLKFCRACLWHIIVSGGKLEEKDSRIACGKLLFCGKRRKHTGDVCHSYLKGNKKARGEMLRRLNEQRGVTRSGRSKLNYTQENQATSEWGYTSA